MPPSAGLVNPSARACRSTPSAGLDNPPARATRTSPSAGLVNPSPRASRSTPSAGLDNPPARATRTSPSAGLVNPPAAHVAPGPVAMPGQGGVRRGNRPTRSRRDARWGMRARRVGEATHPGPGAEPQEDARSARVHRAAAQMGLAPAMALGWPALAALPRHWRGQEAAHADVPEGAYALHPAHAPCPATPPARDGTAPPSPPSATTPAELLASTVWEPDSSSDAGSDAMPVDMGSPQVPVAPTEVDVAPEDASMRGSSAEEEALNPPPIRPRSLRIVEGSAGGPDGNDLVPILTPSGLGESTPGGRQGAPGEEPTSHAADPLEAAVPPIAAASSLPEKA